MAISRSNTLCRNLTSLIFSRGMSMESFAIQPERRMIFLFTDPAFRRQ